MNIRILHKAVALSLACQLSLQAQSLSMIAQEMRAQQSALHKFVTPTRIFSRPRSNISSLIGLDQIPNIEYAWIVNLPGNKIDTLPAGFFKNPKFKNVRWLNLSHNKFRNIEQDGLEGLENLLVLFLDHNQLRSLKPGTLKALKNLKVLTLTGNPRDVALAEQARKELPGTLVINKKMTKNFMLWTLRVVGVVAALALGYILVSKIPVVGNDEQKVALIRGATPAQLRNLGHMLYLLPDAALQVLRPDQIAGLGENVHFILETKLGLFGPEQIMALPLHDLSDPQMEFLVDNKTALLKGLARKSPEDLNILIQRLPNDALPNLIGEGLLQPKEVDLLRRLNSPQKRKFIELSPDGRLAWATTGREPITP